LGVELLYCDPPLARETGDRRFRPLKELADADILTFHVPLTVDGEDPTFHLIDEELLSRRPPGGVLINASRGAVADSDALVVHFSRRKDQQLVLDVWEGEPDIREDLLVLTALGSPHIAGYSYDGKVKGMTMLYQALCEFLGIKAGWSAASFLVQDREPLRFDDSPSQTTKLDQLVRRCYDIRLDDQNLRGVIKTPKEERGRYFDSLRKSYRVRREFGSFEVFASEAGENLRRSAEQLGFSLVE
jgi:erythronate-4-phosphate dehydrogenase